VKPDLSAMIRAAVLLVACSGFFGTVHAAFGPCTVSGQPGVVIDTADNAMPDVGDQRYILEYDPVTSQIRYFLEDNVAAPGQNRVGPLATSTYANNGGQITIPGFGLSFLALGGNVVPNHGTFIHPALGYGCGTLVDNNMDNLADSLVLQLANYIGAPAVLMDIPLTYYPTPNTPPPITHWWLQNPLNYFPNLTMMNAAMFNIGFDYFTPVDLANQRILVSCNGGATTLEVNLQTNADAPGACVGPVAPTNIPTASFWGYAALLLLLMLFGVRALRNRGFGDDFNLRA